MKLETEFVTPIANSGMAYRYEDVVTCSAYDDDYTYSSTYSYNVKINLREFLITRRTPKGMWIMPRYSRGEKHRFVLLGTRKKFACLTKEDAMESFIKRKEKQIRILKTQLNHVEIALFQVRNIVANQKEMKHG